MPHAEQPMRTTRVFPSARCPAAPQRRSCRSYLSVVAIVDVVAVAIAVAVAVAVDVDVASPATTLSASFDMAC